MRTGLIKFAAAVTTALALASGCSDKQNGSATPATTRVNTSSTEQPGSSTPSGTGGAPKVNNPLDAGKFLTQPCSVLSAAQLQAFKVTTPGKAETGSSTSGPSCLWLSDNNIGYDISFATANRNGLSDVYRAGKEYWEGYFEPTEVDGYPAVFNDITDGRPTGSCNITVGISDTMVFRAAEQSSSDRGPQACDGAKAIASAVIRTLKEA